MNAIKGSNPSKMSWIRTLQRSLYRAAKRSPGRKFGILYNHVCKMETLKEAWKRVAANGGCPGVDRRTIQQIKEYGTDKFLEEILKELQSHSYEAETIRRVYIPKGNNGTRPLGIPTVKDRVVQMAVKLIVEPLFEADFLNCSHGFRPRRDNKEAARLTHRYSNTLKWVVDVDLRSYFDTIDHDMLMELVRGRVGDRRILRLIGQWLKAGVLEGGGITANTVGTPQGGVISPLLSNIYLNEIDKLWNDNPSVRLVRFADDMVFMCRSEKQERYVLGKLRGQLAVLKVQVNEEKTRIRHVRESFDFVGFTFKEAYSARHKRMVRVKFPRAKSMQKIRDRIKMTVKKTPLGTDMREIIPKLNRITRGWANYFKIGNSYKHAVEVSNFACQQLRLYWRRNKGRKDTQCTRIWDNEYFYRKGVLYVPAQL